MSSNSAEVVSVETVYKTVRCSTCRGSGQVEIDGWESDCVDCQGYGDHEVPV